MARGDFVLFQEAPKAFADGRISSTNVFKWAIVTLQAGGTPTIAASDPVPTWGVGGTTNLAASEVAAGGNYVAGGATTANPVLTKTGAVTKFSSDPVSWTKLAGNPITGKVAVLYSDTATNKDAIGFLDLTADGTTAIDMVNSDLSLTANANGWFDFATPV